MSHPFQQWENALRLMSESQEDMHELISKFKEMLHSKPQDVEFHFFNGDMYSIPNFAKMRGNVAYLDDRGGITVPHVNIGDDHRYDKDGVSGEGWRVSKDEVSGTWGKIDANIYNLLLPQKIERKLTERRIEGKGFLDHGGSAKDQANGTFALRFDQSENNLFSVYLRTAGKGNGSNVSLRNAVPYQIVILGGLEGTKTHCITGFCCIQNTDSSSSSSPYILFNGILDDGSKGAFIINQTYTMYVFYLDSDL